MNKVFVIGIGFRPLEAFNDYDDEKIIKGPPAKIAAMSFAHPNVVIIIRKA